MANWYMLTLVGKDRPGIVAEVSQVLFEAGGNLGEASMARSTINYSLINYGWSFVTFDSALLVLF